MGALLKIFINGENAFLFLLSFFGLHFRPASNGAAKRNNNLQPLLHPRFRPTISISSCLHGKLVLAKRNTVIHPPAPSYLFLHSDPSYLLEQTRSPILARIYLLKSFTSVISFFHLQNGTSD